ncbi:glutaredoxin [Marinobacter sp. TBZ242]|uniref:Glutaredoxin n=1 Tax=Marinobacter azerbaijanicus TaxID=3050455 RepID=A0ABT7IBG7_9GAMM|nr:glutaredoxin [Marinobacter sp. TBZ242]MDL0431025.1 glutaredoxin [Marinobacter sp. TBZ242]
MRLVIRYFFRGLRLILTPFMLLSEKISTPRSISRSPEEQARVDAACKDLALYQFSACPFCIKVRKEMARLGLNIETRDAQHNDSHRAALAEGGGRIKVPCLLISGGKGNEQWLYESEDIRSWLRQQFEPAGT